MTAKAEARLHVSALLVLAVVLVASPSALAAVPCEGVATALELQGATVTLAQPVAAGAFTPPGRGGRGGAAFTSLRAFCRVAVTLKPTPRSDIRMEAWLPAEGWNGRLQVVGNGGFAGTISYPAMATAVAGGYAAASTDTGHTGASANTFANEETLVDFAHRAVHETTVAAKKIIDLVYGKAPTCSVFNGCSTGGRQALTAAQRYPQDFGGIIAGAPAASTSSQAFGQIWIAQAMAAPGAALPRDALTRLHDAVLQACDAKDGAADGVLENPLACRFDPKVLACAPGADPSSCLTAAQVDAVAKIYAGASNSRTGQPIFPGLERGSELGWSPTPVSYAVDFLKYRVFKNPSWEPAQLNYDSHLAEITKRENLILDADDPDLTPFTSRGGKLLMYQGWAEPGIPPRRIVSYYDEVQKRTRNASQSVRLFMVAGMGHCGGGDGASTFNMLEALEAWQASGKPPDSIPASRTRNGAVDRTRPLCAYPQHAIYKGSGSLDDAASFRCGR
jgi:feruloyl esterase